MVVDNIRNAYLYYGLGAGFEKALRFLQESDFSGMKPGKYEIDGANVYALVQEYQTKPYSEGIWEAHRKYIDIQYVVEGEEQIGYAFAGSLEVKKEYETEGDCLLLSGSGSMVICKESTFAIFGPQDAHMPCMALGCQNYVKKVVVKVST